MEMPGRRFRVKAEQTPHRGNLRLDRRQSLCGQDLRYAFFWVVVSKSNNVLVMVLPVDTYYWDTVTALHCIFLLLPTIVCMERGFGFVSGLVAILLVYGRTTVHTENNILYCTPTKLTL